MTSPVRTSTRPPSSPPPRLKRAAKVSSAPPPPSARIEPSRPRNGSVLPPPVRPLGADYTFKIGDMAVHPSHGLGEVTAIETRDFGGTPGLYYILRILDNGMKVMVPTTAVPQVGLRPVMSGKDADGVLATMRAREVAVDLHPWSRRFRAYTEMIKSGSPHEVAKVLRDMHRLRFDKDLSFGERRLLDQARSLLVKELALAKKMTEPDLLGQMDRAFKS